jgi:hypothetical protein
MGTTYIHNTYIHTVYRYNPTALPFFHLDTVTTPQRMISIIVQIYKLGCEKYVGLRKSVNHRRCTDCGAAGDPPSCDSWRDVVGPWRVRCAGRLCMFYWNSLWYIAWWGKAILCSRQSGIAFPGGEIHYLVTERFRRTPLCACVHVGVSV